MSEFYFFDTYAFFEIINGNPNYRRFRDATAVTTIFNLAELNYGLKKITDEKTADLFTEKYRFALIDVYLEDIKLAMSLKKMYKELSIPDVVGYVIAKRLNIKFLTGDECFRYFDNVEFVKK